VVPGLRVRSSSHLPPVHWIGTDIYCGMSGMVEGRRRPGAAPAVDPAVRVMDGLRRMVRVLSASARELSRRGGVSGAQLFVLRQIAASPGLSVGDVVARTLSRQSTVSEVVGRLVERRLVERRPGARDARQTALTLTARGRRLMESSEPTAQEQLARGLRALPPAQLAQLAEAFDAWLAASDLADVPATMFFEEAARPAQTRPRRASREGRAR
jgi:DNA-binding MarR family transcriptional regulator